MSYGKSKDKFPLRYGDIMQSDCCTVGVWDWFSDGFPIWMQADMVYVDPPWSLANANMFRGKACRGYIDTFEPYLAALMGWIAATRPTTCYIEMGAKNLTSVISMLEKTYATVQSWPILYYKKHPCYLVRGADEATGYDFSGMDDAKTPHAAVSIDKPMIVGDPCTGRGLSAIAGIRHGCKFVGTEMIPDKLSVCIDNLSRGGLVFQKL